jgi:hypothetical protein
MERTFTRKNVPFSESSIGIGLFTVLAGWIWVLDVPTFTHHVVVNQNGRVEVADINQSGLTDITDLMIISLNWLTEMTQ